MNDKPLGRSEFIALMAMLFATIAFTIDAVLPALPEIAKELTPDDLNRAQLVLTSFVLGMGVGTFFVGPLSDAFGRRPVLLSGAVIYCIATLVGGTGDTLEMVLIARFVQGVGAAGPRVVGQAVVRDIYKGREMARITSFVMMVFGLVPALAPTVGAMIVAISGWRAVFISFLFFSIVSAVWFALRQPETLPKDKRRPIRMSSMKSATIEVFSLPMVRLSLVAQSLCMGILFGEISSTQQIFDISYGRGDTFHYWFALVALIATSASFINAKLVVRVGMRRMVGAAVLCQVVMSALSFGLLSTAILPPTVEFAFYIVWKVTIFMMVGLTLGNLTALSMEPLGHIAGLAGSVIISGSTVLAVLIAVPMGLAFDGTPKPLAAGIFLSALAAYLVVRRMEKLERVIVPVGP